MAAVVLKDICKRFGSHQTIHNVNIDIADKDFVVFVGPSGCGKSTLLRLIAGLEDISAGSMTIDGAPVNDLPPSKRGIAMVFQSYALYPHMTAYQNMAFGLELAKSDTLTIDSKVREAARILALEPLLDRLPKAMSGGQRQRVAIGRAIVRNPKVFLFDEPLSNLDAALRVQMRIEIARLHREMNATMVYVTHDQVEAMTLATKIVVLRAGRVEQVGTPLDLYNKPDNLFVAGFIGSPQMNFIKGRIASADVSGIKVTLPGGGQVLLPYRSGNVGDEVTVGIRPEHLTATQAPHLTPVSGTIFAVEQLGESHLLYVKLADDSLLTYRGAFETGASVGGALTVYVDPERCHVFANDGQALKR
ncbi:ABC transporter ATP-binding protein [Methylovirgula sp. 4M-Z18]|uniref:ABC transporter ATP-binding protein n=1 Tax=Methylovirgula sp. 4M-Z18 TaxID=2293567 RepID=UPI000E2F16A5|nr:sn-glycerol-3-phosphate ABC transporter ATP-binding protein UgpC [Methylovirgula sp. 4M-Z18]RFB78730.1 sn-glycerol-3-phosphate ABC transporter ATP-binding protein UgpC [Methylovirgula sp. 4M-Z18]